MKQITVSAPGKIHLLGEHIVVYGKPAIIAAIDKRCQVKLVPRKDNNIEIFSKNFRTSQMLSIDEVLKKTTKARTIWNQFIQTKDIQLLRSLTNDVLDYPFLAVGQSLIDFQLEDTKGFSVEINSQIPMGSGCGSSSAIAVSIAASLSLVKNETLDKKKILDTAIRIEEFKHGTPSGGDCAAVLYGGFLWFEKKENKRVIKPINVPLDDTFWENFILADSGIPEESTGQMIGVVREYRMSHRQEAERIFADQEHLVHKLAQALTTNNSTLMIYIIKAGERNLEKMGVVSPFVKNVISEIEKKGAAAKISGGGGKTKGSGMLLVYNRTDDAVFEVLGDHALPFLKITLGGSGLQYKKL